MKNGMMLMPPPPDKCQQCATDHDPEMPHNQQSLYWQYWFYGKHGCWPTWSDAMAHCSNEMKAAWTKELKKHGVEVTTDATD